MVDIGMSRGPRVASYGSVNFEASLSILATAVMVASG